MIDTFCKMESSGASKSNNDVEYSTDEAIDLAGHGRYSYLVLLACSVTSLAVALDMFGFSVVVAAASCDLRLTIAITGLLNSTPLAGIFFAFPWGYLADTRGRRFALLLSTSGGFFFCTLSSFSNSWQLMLVLKLVGGIFSASSYPLTMTYISECIDSRWKNRYIFYMTSANLWADFLFYFLALVILPLDIYYPISWLGITFRSWRLYSLVLTAPLGIGALLLSFLHESPKLLACRNKREEALEVLQKIFKRNGGIEGEYPVKILANEGIDEKTEESFCSTIVKQTVPLFKPPLLLRTLQLFYLMAICGSTNNVFIVWYPTMVNLFYNSLSSGTSDDMSFCERIVSNITTSDPNTDEIICDDTISTNTIYAGMILGLTFTVLNLAASAVASYRRSVLIACYFVSAICLASVEWITEPITNMIAFTMVQCTVIGIGSIAGYFADLYPTAYRGLVTSLSGLFSRIVALIGINVVGIVITNHCSLAFYSWMVYVASGIAVTLFLPSDSILKVRNGK